MKIITIPPTPHKGMAVSFESFALIKKATMESTVEAFGASEDPPAYAVSLVKPWNCEEPGGHIRLDNKAEDHPEILAKDIDP